MDTKTLGPLMRGIGSALRPLFEDVNKRLDRLERSGSMQLLGYCGTWSQGAYRLGDIVTDKGALWISHADTEARPGTSSDWQCIVKSAR